MKPITQTINTSNNAHVKISVAKITPTITKSPHTVEFATRDSVDTPPAITDYARATAILLRNFNQLVRQTEYPNYTKSRDTSYLACIANNNVSGDKYRTISTTKRDTATIAEQNKYPRIHAWRTIAGTKTTNGGYCEHNPMKAILFGGKYYRPAISNINRKDKPNFRRDSTIFFDNLSEDYSA